MTSPDILNHCFENISSILVVEKYIIDIGRTKENVWKYNTVLTKQKKNAQMVTPSPFNTYFCQNYSGK